MRKKEAIKILKFLYIIQDIISIDYYAGYKEGTLDKLIKDIEFSLKDKHGEDKRVNRRRIFLQKQRRNEESSRSF
jgi:hypothetical protein